MTAIPARAAGVGEVIVACPRPDAAVFAAALEAGVDRFFQVGGAHAIAAMAYGTRTVPRVDKIVGPGNRWVSAAKSLVSADCGIDFYAGPTEILIVSATGPASWIAADLIAQAEHDPDARAVFITSNRRLAERVAARSRSGDAGVRPRAPVDSRGTAASSCAATCARRSHSPTRRRPNIWSWEPRRWRGASGMPARCSSAAWTAQVAGDYAIGSNHVLPTAGAARFRGGLNAADFVKLVSVQRLTKAGLGRIAKTVTTLARAEGLEGHARSIDVQ